MKLLYLGILCLFSTIKVSASTDTTASTPVKTSLTLAAIYSSNANYYGQTAEEKLPYVLTNASVKFPGGLWLSGGAYKLLNFAGAFSAGVAGVGVDLPLLKNLTGSIGYSRSFFPANSPMLQAANENTVSGSLDYDWNWLKTNVSADYAFGQEEDYFLSLSNSKLISLGSLFSQNDFVSLEPTVEVVAGTQRFYETYTVEKKKRDKLLDKIKAPITPPGQQEPTTATVESTSFDVLSYNVKLPLAYNRANYMIETSYQVSLLGKGLSSSTNKPRSFFNLGVYYLF